MKINRKDLRKIILESILKEQEVSKTTSVGAKKTKGDSDPSDVKNNIESSVKKIIDKIVNEKEFNAKIFVGRNVINVRKANPSDLDKDVTKALRADDNLKELRKDLKVGRAVNVNYDKKVNSESQASAENTNNTSEAEGEPRSTSNGSTSSSAKTSPKPNETVRKIQEILNGLNNTKISKDGIWGQKTDEAWAKALQTQAFRDKLTSYINTNKINIDIDDVLRNSYKNAGYLSQKLGKPKTLTGVYASLHAIVSSNDPSSPGATNAENNIGNFIKNEESIYRYDTNAGHNKYFKSKGYKNFDLNNSNEKALVRIIPNTDELTVITQGGMIFRMLTKNGVFRGVNQNRDSIVKSMEFFNEIVKDGKVAQDPSSINESLSHGSLIRQRYRRY